VREPDGLAMSSRNVRLNPEMRAAAPVIYKVLQWAKQALMQDIRVPEINKEAIQRLSDAGLRPEYFEIVDGISLEAIATKGALMGLEDQGTRGPVVACTAVFAGEVRLIDNLMLYP